MSNRPSSTLFTDGFFVEDFIYDESGDLDKSNGRFCKTPEYPNGVYAYFVGVTTGSSGLLEFNFTLPLDLGLVTTVVKDIP